MSRLLLVMLVLCVANQLIAPTALPSRSMRSTVVCGSIASGKNARSSSGSRSNALLERLTLASCNSPCAKESVADARSACALHAASTMPSTTAPNVLGRNPPVLVLYKRWCEYPPGPQCVCVAVIITLCSPVDVAEFLLELCHNSLMHAAEDHR